MRNDSFIPAHSHAAGPAVQPAFNTAVIEACDITNDSATASILMNYPLENDDAITIRLPLEDHVLAQETYALRVSFENSAGLTVRYVLHKPAWLDEILYPAYTGQALLADAVVEVWGIIVGTDADISDNISLTIGPAVFTTPAQINTTSQITGTTTTLTPTEP